MRWHDPKDTEAADRKAFLRSQLDRLDESPAAGITRQVLAQGEDSLSTKQRWVYENEVIGNNRCNVCSQIIPDSELLASHGNGGICGWCEHMMGKSD